MKARLLLALFALALVVLTPRAARAGEHITVLVPDKDNLQYMSFWVAQAGGYFTRAGIDVELVVSPSPQQTETMFESQRAEAAVLAPPMYLRFIGQKLPLVLVANLLRNDPIDLVVRRDVLAARKVDAATPLKERLLALHGLRLGIAPHPPTRLRALYASVGLDAEKELDIVILHGREQNAAFTEKRVDALYAHTPYLEKAIVNDDAVVLVEQTRGEVRETANPQIHCLAFRRSVAEARPAVVAAMQRAIGEAEKSIHASQKDTVDVLARAFPKRDRRELETIVRLYEPAIPDSPEVHAENLAPALALFPDGMPKPDLSGIDLSTYVAKAPAPQAAGAEAPAVQDGKLGQRIALGVGLLTLVAIVVLTLAARKKPDHLAAILVFLGTLALPSAAGAAEHLTVVVAEKENLQYLAFWYAKAAGLFAQEGIELEVVVASAPGGHGAPPVVPMLERGEADAALLAPPQYLHAISTKAPIVVVANLFQNDPYVLVVRRTVADERKLVDTAPVKDRLVALKGLTVGIPAASLGRLRALFASQGLDVEKDVKTKVILAKHQAQVLDDKEIDVAYLATPSLEKVVAEDGAVVLFDQAGAEVPALANAMTNVFAVSKKTLETRHEVVAATVRALAEAERRIHASQADVVTALARELAGRDRRHLEAIVQLYEPGIPASTAVHAADLAPSLALIPEAVPKPELAGVDLAPFVATELSSQPAGAGGGAGGSVRTIAIAMGAVAVLAIAFVVLRRRREATAPSAPED